MLVLSRLSGETVRIGDDIVVTVVEVGRGRVRLAFSAPPEVRILRGELLTPEAAAAHAAKGGAR